MAITDTRVRADLLLVGHAGGKVTSVDSEPPGKLPRALRSCIVEVLQGLRFPCYANTTQRPWPRQMVIME